MDSTVNNGPSRRLFRRASATALAFAALMAVAGPAPAAAASGSTGDTRVISDKWILSVGGYLADFNTSAAAGAAGPLGAVIQLEDQLDLQQDKVFARGDGLYRFNERHGIGFGFWSLSRTGTRTIDTDITWDGVTYTGMGNLETNFDVSWLRIDWRYSFLHTDRGEAGINVGISAYDFTAGLSGMGSVNGGPSGSFNRERAITLPIPTYGLYVNFAITPNVLFKSSFNFLYLNASDLEINVGDISMLFEWYFSEHVGIGGGSARTGLNYKDTGTNPLTVDYKQSGFLGYFTFAWGDVD